MRRTLLATLTLTLWTIAAAAHAQSLTLAGPATLSGVCFAAPLEYGTAPVTGTIGAAGEQDCRRFSAEAGDRVRVRAVATSGSLAPSVAIGAPGCAGATGPEVTCAIGAAGSYVVSVRDGAGTRTGGYALTLQRLDDPVGCSPLAYEVSTRTGAITAGETECWRFAGAAGDRVRLRLVTAAAALAPRAEVLRPDGTTRCGATAAGETTCPLDATGTHTVLVRDAGAAGGGYSLSLQRLSDPVGCQNKTFIPAGILGTIATTGEADCWRFAGAAGQRVRVHTVRSAGALEPVVEVLRPSGTTRCTPSAADDLTCRLDITGRHTIVVRDGGAGTRTGDYRIGLQRLDDPVGCSSFSYGTAVTTGSLGSWGETDCWRFTGRGGERVRARVIATSGGWTPIVEMIGPSGATECAAGHGGLYTCVLEGYGAQPHTLLVRDSIGTRSGGYRISIQRLNAPVGCSGEPVAAGADGWAVVAGIDCWELDGEAGDRVRVRVVDSGWNWDPVTEVVGPDGSTVCQGGTADSFTCDLDVDGPHAILVRSASGVVYGGYRIATLRLNGDHYQCPNLATSPGPELRYILADAEIDCYTTWAPEAGSRELKVEATSGTLDPVVEVLRPDGTLRCLQRRSEEWFGCYGDIYEYQRVLVYDASGTGHGNYEIDRR